MKYEIINLKDVKVIGIAREIDMDIASPEYPCGVMVPVKLSRSALLAKNL